MSLDGFEMDVQDMWISSFKIIESGISFHYIGAVTNS